MYILINNKRIFKWLIDETIEVEVEYLKCLAKTDKHRIKTKC
jgi:hypothetical protein